MIISHFGYVSERWERQKEGGRKKRKERDGKRKREF